MRGYTKPGLEREEKPTVKDIIWAAGVFEGEGCISSTEGKRWSAVMRMDQKDDWALKKFKKWFGGSVGERGNGKSKSGDKLRIKYWQVTGTRARGIALTFYPFLSPRRQNSILKHLFEREL